MPYIDPKYVANVGLTDADWGAPQADSVNMAAGVGSCLGGASVAGGLGSVEHIKHHQSAAGRHRLREFFEHLLRRTEAADQQVEAVVDNPFVEQTWTFDEPVTITRRKV